MRVVDIAREPDMLELSTDKVAQVIVRARELEARTGAWELPDRRHPGEDTAEMVLEALRNDPARLALASFLQELSRDELAELVALMWVGRGSFEPAEWPEAVQTAQEEYSGVSGSVRYLLREPLLADYLEEGLDRLGYSIEDVERGVV
jgi:hypothetical protein